MWSKIKQILRSHAPGTEEELLRAAKIAFQSISTADRKGFLLAPNTLHDKWKCSNGAYLLKYGTAYRALSRFRMTAPRAWS